MHVSNTELAHFYNMQDLESSKVQITNHKVSGGFTICTATQHSLFKTIL